MKKFPDVFAGHHPVTSLSAVEQTKMSAEPEQNENQQNEENQEIYDNNQDYQNDQGQSEYVNPNITAWGIALYDYAANSEGELSFSAGETIGIIQDLGDGWSKGDLYGVEGIFPTNYIELYNDPNHNPEDPNNANQAPITPETMRRKKQADEELMQKRRQKREQLKGEMKDLKQDLENKTKRREQLENELNELTQQKQKQRAELSRMKAENSDSQSIILDIIKIYQTLELFTEASIQQQTVTTAALEALQHFVTELQKEAKSSTALQPFAQKMQAKVKDYKTALDTTHLIAEDADRTAKEFKVDLERLKDSLDVDAKKRKK